MAEWFKAAVLKTVVGLTPHRGFESLSLRWWLLVVSVLPATNNQSPATKLGKVPEYGLMGAPAKCLYEA